MPVAGALLVSPESRSGSRAAVVAHEFVRRIRWARYWHFSAMVALVLLSVVHVFMVFAVDPYRYRRDTRQLRRSAIARARNARRSTISLRPARGLRRRRPHEAERWFVTVGGIERREFLTWSGGLLSAAFLAACDSRGPKSQKGCSGRRAKNAGIERALYRHDAMDRCAPAPSTPGTSFPATSSRQRFRCDESARGK